MKKILLILSVLIISYILFASKAYAILVADWNFNEGTGLIAHDSSSFGNNGDINSFGPNWVAGKYGTGLEYDRNPEGRVIVPDSNSLDLTNSFTIMAWVNPSDFNNTGNHLVVVSKYTHPNPMIFNLKTANDSSGFWEFDATQANLYSLTPIQSDQWQHLAVTYDGLEMKLYFNGNLEDVVAASGSLNVDGNPVIIGGQNCTSNCRDPFLGIIDEVRIYNNALTQAEIQRDMSFDTTIPEPSSMLLLSTGLIAAFLKKRYSLGML